MNTNRNNNRRRGRGNNRGPGGGNQSNRIDNRARGNAPQMLEKFRKLAHDASLNDDRVQTEYYLQFADHYFRVIADSRSPKDEQRNRRDNEAGDDDQDDDASRDDRNDDRGHDNRDSSGRDNSDRGDNRDSSGRDNNSRGRDDSGREDRPQARRGRNRRDAEDDDAQAEGSPQSKGANQSEGANADQDENPFVRDAKPRKPRGRPKKKVEAADDGPDSLSPDSLPPAIARASDDDGPDETETGGRTSTAKPRKKSPRATGRTRSRPAEDGDAEGLEAVG